MRKFLPACENSAHSQSRSPRIAAFGPLALALSRVFRGRRPPGRLYAPFRICHYPVEVSWFGHFPLNLAGKWFHLPIIHFPEVKSTVIIIVFRLIFVMVQANVGFVIASAVACHSFLVDGVLCLKPGEPVLFSRPLKVQVRDSFPSACVWCRICHCHPFSPAGRATCTATQTVRFARGSANSVCYYAPPVELLIVMRVSLTFHHRNARVMRRPDAPRLFHGRQSSCANRFVYFVWPTVAVAATGSHERWRHVVANRAKFVLEADTKKRRRAKFLPPLPSLSSRDMIHSILPHRHRTLLILFPKTLNSGVLSSLLSPRDRALN